MLHNVTFWTQVCKVRAPLAKSAACVQFKGLSINSRESTSNRHHKTKISWPRPVVVAAPSGKPNRTPSALFSLLEKRYVFGECWKSSAVWLTRYYGDVSLAVDPSVFRLDIFASLFRNGLNPGGLAPIRVQKLFYFKDWRNTQEMGLKSLCAQKRTRGSLGVKHSPFCHEA